MRNGLDILGVDWGDALSTGVSAVSEVAKGVSRQVKASDAVKDNATALTASIAADTAATAARAKALYSEAVKAPTLEADRAMSSLADQAQDEAGAGLSSDSAKKRGDAAKTALTSATQAWQSAAASKDADKIAKAEAVRKAADTTYMKASNREIRDHAASVSMDEPPSWFTRPVVGPIPGWATLVGGAGIATGLALLAKRLIWGRR